MTPPKKRPMDESIDPAPEAAPVEPVSLRDQVSDREAELVIGKPPVSEPPPAPAPPENGDPAKAAANRKMLLELDAHDVRREGTYVQQAQGSGPVHYLPPQSPAVGTSDAVLAAQGSLEPGKADALVADEEKFQRPGFVDAMKQKMAADAKSQEEGIQSQIDTLNEKLAALKKSNGGGASTADKLRASAE